MGGGGGRGRLGVIGQRHFQDCPRFPPKPAGTLGKEWKTSCGDKASQRSSCHLVTITPTSGEHPAIDKVLFQS